MNIELRTIPDCPNDVPARALFVQALEAEGLDAGQLSVREIATDAEAAELNFHGSPTFTVNGADLFPATTEPAVTCRVYTTVDGLKGQPGLADLRKAVRVAADAAAAK